MSQVAVLAQGSADELEKLQRVLVAAGVPAQVVSPPGQKANT